MHLSASAFFGFLVLYSKVWVIISYGIVFYEIIYEIVIKMFEVMDLERERL